MEKLKPCPCGTVKPRWARHSQWGDHWEGITMYRIDCSDCDATTGWHEGRNEAVDVWNTQCTMHSRQSAIIVAQAELIEALSLSRLTWMDMYCGMGMLPENRDAMVRGTHEFEIAVNVARAKLAEVQNGNV